MIVNNNSEFQRNLSSIYSLGKQVQLPFSVQEFCLEKFPVCSLARPCPTCLSVCRRRRLIMTVQKCILYGMVNISVPVTEEGGDGVGFKVGP